MYIERNIKNQLVITMQQFPAILITGPRQSGKTTFLFTGKQVEKIKNNFDIIRNSDII